MARPMPESELSALLAAEETDALGYLGGKLAEDRKKAMDYYEGKPFGNEASGSSQVVLTDVADTIEWILPALLKIFTAGDEVVRFDPQGPEDEETARQATEYVNWIFTRDNPGFLILYSLFKDALLQKNGFSKVYFEEGEKVRRRPFKEAEPDAVAALMEAMGEGAEVEYDAADPTSGRVTAKTRTGKVCVESVPPEEFLINRTAKTVQRARYVAHRSRKSASELIEAGYDARIVETLSADTGSRLTDESRARNEGVDETADITADPALNPAMREIWVTEAYPKVDYDGDGVAERRKVTHVGSVILDNEPWDGPVPFVSVTPIIMPHRFYGKSVAELVMDLQLIRSTLLREMLNNQYAVNQPRNVVSDKVVLDDMLTIRQNGLVRLQDGALPSQGHVQPLTVPPMAGQSLPIMEWLEGVKENRTGVTRYNQGVDANSLNKTATGISQIMTAAQQRIELIARIFAETGVKDLFGHILWNIRAYPELSARAIRLRNEWVQMDPAAWRDAEFDTSINVGLGTGNKQEMLMHLNNILAIQMQAIGFQKGVNGPFVTAEHVYNTVAGMVENAGLKNPDKYFGNPSQAPAQQPTPPPPDPEMIKVEQQAKIEMAKLQLQARKTEAELALDREKAAAEMALKRDGMVAEHMFKRESADREMQVADERFGKEMAARKGRDLMETRAGMGIPPDAEANVLAQIQAGQEQMAQMLAQGFQQLSALAQANLQAAAAPKQITVERDGAGRITGATATPTLQ